MAEYWIYTRGMLNTHLFYFFNNNAINNAEDYFCLIKSVNHALFSVTPFYFLSYGNGFYLLQKDVQSFAKWAEELVENGTL